MAAALRIQTHTRGFVARQRYSEVQAGCLRMLPDDLLENVFAKLEAADLCMAHAACPRWRKVAQAERLWDEALRANFSASAPARPAAPAASLLPPRHPYCPCSLYRPTVSAASRARGSPQRPSMPLPHVARQCY